MRITGIDNAIHPVASHCKPWRDSTNEERLNGENGSLLPPGIDHQLYRGFIGLEDFGVPVISLVAHPPSLRRIGIDTLCDVNVGGFTDGNRQHLDFHRNAVLPMSARLTVRVVADQTRNRTDAWLQGLRHVSDPDRSDRVGIQDREASFQDRKTTRKAENCA